MQVTLQPETEQYLQEKVKQGQYNSIDEAIEESVKILIARDKLYQGRFEELQREIAIGVAASERGEVINREELFDHLSQKLEQRHLEVNYLEQNHQ
ncbi:MAG: type II toxin-antitoxin system ParD family antitoxin [Cyanobacteria bacterium SBLK]|nr:type II toxin-antitoxin system ParD family antitoxin [Cyanobacteria bacterium SBLK]